MFAHFMIGSNGLERARVFYDATFAAFGDQPGEMDPRGRWIYVHEGGRLIITKAINGQAATSANGGTTGIAAASPDNDLAWPWAGTEHRGNAVESPPAERPNGTFAAYLRYLDGNKLIAGSKPTG